MSGGRHPRYGAAWSGGYTPTDSDAIAYIAAVEAVSGEPAMSDFMKEAVDDFYIKLKADGNFGTNLELHVYGVAQTLAGGLIPMKGTTGTNVGGNLVGADYDRSEGITGNGTNKGVLVSTSRGIDTYSDNDFCCYAITPISNTAGLSFFSRPDGDVRRTIAGGKIGQSPYNLSIYGVDTIAVAPVGPVPPIGTEFIFSGKRTSATNVAIKDSITGTWNQTLGGSNGSGTSNVTMGVLCDWNNGSITGYRQTTLRVLAWGYAAEIGTEADFYDAVAALLTAINTDAA